MSYYELKDNDVFINTIEAYPNYKFYVNSGSIYINDQQAISGAYSDNILGVPEGYVSLFEYNIDRPESGRIYPFITKGGQKQKFKTISDVDFNTQFGYGGSIISSSYNMSSSISKITIDSVTDTDYKYLRSLKSSFNHYSFWSQRFNFSNFETPTVSNSVVLLNVPSIFYGNSLKKGEVTLNAYISGTLVGTLNDSRQNGELVQTYGPTTGSVEGVVMYDEGIIVLTGSSVLGTMGTGGSSINQKWTTFGFGLESGETMTLVHTSGSYSLEFDTISQFQNMTVLAKAPYGELNHSNNPTYLKYTGTNPSYSTSSYQFIETNREIKNIVPAAQTDIEPPFQKETYISKICIYDRNKRLVGVCKLATPIRKTEVNEYLFKMKIDL
tara:strand:+ start:1791 stop:2939 length:1149 start_codon:yes stop_codon:yes gene_type:complete